MKHPQLILVISAISAISAVYSPAAPPQYQWIEQEIDPIEIGNGLALTDVDGDSKTDIILADKSTVQWYQSPDWTKHIIARDLTVRDNVCVAARDIDGDGKCEIAVGGQWNPTESIEDGSVIYLIAPNDRTKPWAQVKLQHEPSTHRMHWIKTPKDDFSLAVKPLRGRGTVDGIGPGLNILEYIVPDQPRHEWTTRLVNDRLHLAHNFHPVNWDDDPEEELLTAAMEGVWHFDRYRTTWGSTELSTESAGEVRDGKLPGGKRFFATIEPMHGTLAAVYVDPGTPKTHWPRSAVLDDAFIDGHALAIADFLGIGSDQVIVGWRAMNPVGNGGEPGIKMFTPLDEEGVEWRATRISGPEIAVEDIKVGDLSGDSLPDIVAAGRQTKNLKIFFTKK